MQKGSWMRYLSLLLFVFAVVTFAQELEPQQQPPPSPMLSVPYLSQVEDTVYPNDCFACVIAMLAQYAGYTDTSCADVFGWWVGGAVEPQASEIYLHMTNADLIAVLMDHNMPVATFKVESVTEARSWLVFFLQSRRPVGVIVPSALDGWTHSVVVVGYDANSDMFLVHDPAERRLWMSAQDMAGSDGDLRLFVWGW